MFGLGGNWRCSSKVLGKLCGFTRSIKKICRVNLEEISILIWEWGEIRKINRRESRKVEK